MKTPKPLKRLAGPRKRNPQRKKREWNRAYGSKKRVEFIRTLPCAACGIVGFSENAHVPPKGEAGAGYKADYRFIAPLCGRHHEGMGSDGYTHPGCHAFYDEARDILTADYPDFDPEKAAADTETLWLGHLEELKK